MKTLSIVSYIVGSILLIVSCFTTGVTVTWILGGLAVVFLVVGCVFQFYVNKARMNHQYHRSHT